jgi:hypothetical protein
MSRPGRNPQPTNAHGHHDRGSPLPERSVLHTTSSRDLPCADRPNTWEGAIYMKGRDEPDTRWYAAQCPAGRREGPQASPIRGPIMTTARNALRRDRAGEPAVANVHSHSSTPALAGVDHDGCFSTSCGLLRTKPRSSQRPGANQPTLLSYSTRVRLGVGTSASHPTEWRCFQTALQRSATGSSPSRCVKDRCPSSRPRNGSGSLSAGLEQDPLAGWQPISIAIAHDNVVAAQRRSHVRVRRRILKAARQIIICGEHRRGCRTRHPWTQLAVVAAVSSAAEPLVTLL